MGWRRKKGVIEGRQPGVLRKRTLANGHGFKKASSASQSVLRTINEAPNYTVASVRTHTLAELRFSDG